MRLISLEEMKEIDDKKNATEGRLISLEEMDAIQGGRPPLPAPSEGSYVSPAGAAFVPPRSGKRAVQPEQPKAAPVIPPPSDQPEMRAYEPTILERLGDLIPQNRAAAANKLAAMRISEERKIPVNEAYRQMKEAVGVRGLLGARPSGQPMWNPEGRSPIATAVKQAPYALESVLDAPKGAVESALKFVRAGNIAKPYDSSLIDKAITYLGDDANDIFIPNLPEKLGLDPKDPEYAAIAGFGKSLGASLMSIVTQATAGGLATAVTANPIVGAGVGIAAGTATAYRPSVDDFMVQVRDKLNAESKKIFGRPMDEKEWNAAKEKYKNLAREYGAWEAGTESIANALFLKAFAAPLKTAKGATLKKYLPQVVAVGSEMAGETITGLGQNSVELRAGLTEDELTVVDAFKQQFIQTMLTMGVMAGGVKAIQAGNRFYETKVLPHINPDSALAKAIKNDIDLVALKQAAPLRSLNEANIKGSKQVAPSKAYAAPTPSPAKPSQAIAMPSGNAPKPVAGGEEDEQVPGMPSDDEIEEDTEDATRLTPVSLATQTQPVIGFTTEKGSTYSVTPDGKTVRTKRSEGRGQGKTYAPHTALYVNPGDHLDILSDRAGGWGDNSVRLGYIQNQTFTPIETAADIPSGAVPTVGVFNKKTGQTVNLYTAQTRPLIGLHPVEKLYMPNGMSNLHVGNKIVKIELAKDAQPQDARGDQTPAAAALPVTPTVAPISGKPPSDPPPGNLEVKGLPTQEIPLSSLKLSKDVPQFKLGATSEGVVEPLEGKFERTGVAPIQVWQRLDGALEVISGRHRFDLAKRSGEETIPAQVHYEAQGFDQKQAAILDAELNIRDGQGKVKDYVNYFKESGIDRNTAHSRGLLARATGKRSYTIATQGSDDLITAVRNDQIGDEAAYYISLNAPNNDRLQAVGINAIQEGKSANTATNIMQAVKALGGERDTTQDMFGFDDSAIKEAEEMAKIASRKQREIQTRLSAITGAAKNPAMAKAEGIDIRDEQAVQRRINELRQMKAAWENWSTSPELVADIRAERGVPAPDLAPVPDNKPPVSKPSSVQGQTLPRELAGAKPRYSYGDKQFELTFESDVDKAAYIASQPRPSKRDADYVQFVMDATGLSEEEVRAHGQIVRDNIKATAKTATPGMLTVPATVPKKDFVLTKPSDDELRKKAERDAAEAKRLKEEQEAAERKAKADREAKNFTLTGSDSPADIAIAHGQQELVPAESGVEAEDAVSTSKLPQSISEAINNELKRQKRAVAQAKKDSQNPDSTLRQRADASQVYNLANSALQRMRANIFNAEDAAEAALKNNDAKAFEDYAGLFPKAAKEIEKSIAATKTEPLKGEGNEPTKLGESGTGELEGAQPKTVQGTGGGEKTGSGTSGGGGEDVSGDDGTGGRGSESSGRMGDDEGEVSADKAGTKTRKSSVTRSGTNKRSNRTTQPSIGDAQSGGNPRLEPASGTRSQDRADDFIITDADEIGEGGAKTKYKQNIAAIQLLKQLSAERRQATREEQAVLAKYVGWGGIPQAFYRDNNEVSKGWENETKELKELLTPEEYAAAAASTRNAHYTSTEIVSAMWDAIKHFGYQGGRVLEPSVGVGNFFGMMPPGLRKASQLTGVELDHITGGIAKQLYPHANIAAPVGFQDFSAPDNYFDLAIGNPPFGQEGIYDASNRKISGFSIHNYFFAKSLNTVRPNGVLAMVVTNRLLDSVGDKARAYIAERAQFLGAIRLPNDAFAKNAGTQVTTDIIFLRKLKDGEEPTGQKWMDARQYTDKNGKTVLLNEYFIRNPDMMLGDFGQFGSMYSAEDAALVAREGQDTPALLKEAIKKLPGKFMDAPTAAPVLETVEPMNDVSHVKIGSMFEQDGKIFVRKPDLLNKQQAFPVEFASAMAEKRVRGMIGVRDAFIAVRKMQLDEKTDDTTLEQAREKLNQTYDEFVAEYGLIRTDVNKRLMRDDPTWPQMAALEEGYDKGISAKVAEKTGAKAVPPSAKKADIFTKRTQKPYKRPEKASSAKDAMLISLAEYGNLNLDYMASIYGKTQSAIISELSGSIYWNPQGGWESKDQYLSGNVKKKLAQAIEAAKTDPNMEANVEALKAVQPTDIEAIDIDVKIGSHWVPADVMEDFVQHITKTTETEAVYNPVAAKWTLSAHGILSSVGAQWGTDRSRVMDVLNAAANHRQIVITNTMPDDTRVRDVAATAAANEKVNEVKEEWKRWVWSDDNRRVRLQRIYNDTFNTDVLQQYDGTFLNLPGKVGDDIIMLRPHQVNFVWRGLQSGVALADHVVGAGKTFSLIALAMEKRRIGQARKPMLVVPNHLVGQWAADFAKLYPNANILATTKNDFKEENRKNLFARIATGDWDAVIVAHSSFGKVEVSAENQARFIENQIEDCTDSIQAMRISEGKKSRNVKQIQKQKAKLAEKLKKLLDTGAKDDSLTFEELGVDALFVDEFHEFKNLAFSTSMQGTGLGNPKGSQKATDMFLKIQSVLKSTGGKNIVVATGTPISNSMSEMYTMQRYLDYQNLKDQGIAHFDAWARTFGEVVTDWELSPSGQYKMSSKFSKFVNLPELMMRYQSFADVINRDDINRQLAEQGKTLPIPKIKGGKPENVVVNRSSDQAEYIGVPRVDEKGRETYPETSLIWRSEHLPKKAEKGADNMLKIMSDARKAALDMRLINPNLSDNPLSKVNVAAENILHIYKKWGSVKGTQLVFCDLSTPKSSVSKEKAELRSLIELAEEGDEDAQEKLDKMSPDDFMALESEFSVYDDLKEKLIALGIPANEIAFIHDANTDIRKEELFAKVRSGMVRVLVGSTGKMGAGMNVQERLVALHHLDAPWRPSDLEQREGRIIRQGNKLFDEDPQGFEIEILRYATKQTLDSRMWQTLETKARFIEQVRKGTGERQAEDIGGEAANSAEMKAASSGNPLILEEMTLRKTIRDLETQRYNHERSQHRIRDIIRIKKAYLDNTLKRKIKFMDADLEFAPEKFAATIYGKTYEKQSEIGAAILDAAKKMRADKKDSVEIGNYGGFKLIIDDASSKIGINAILTIKGNGEYQINAHPDASDVGLGVRLRNAVPDLQKINDLKAEIKKEEDEVVKLESQAGTWDKEAELQAVKGQHSAIIEELKPKEKSEQEPIDESSIPLANIDADLMGKPALSETNEFAKRTKEEIRQETINQYKGLRAKLGRLPTQIAKWEVGLDLQKTVTELLTQTSELKREIEATKPRRDSAEVFLAKALTEYSNGNISKEVLDVIQAAYQKEPALLEGLQLSVVKPEKNGKANARFDPIDRIVALFKETTGAINPSTIRHELTHSLEQMMTPDQQMVVVQSWLKALQQAIKKYPEEKHQEYLRAVLNFFNEPNDINYQAALDILPNYEMYQFLNPSEYWAINAEKLLAAELGTAWNKFKRAVRQLWESLKKVLGFDNRYDVHKVFNQVMGGGMERINYSSIVQGAVENISEYSPTLADIDDEKLLKKYSRPNTPTTSDETVKELAVDSAVKAKKIFKDAVKDPKGAAAKVGNTLTDAILEARNQAVFYGAGLEARDFARYGGELRTAQDLVTASVALDNAIRSGNIAQEVLFRGGIRYNSESGMYEAMNTKKGMHGVYEAQKKLLDKLGKQVGTDIIQGYLEAKRSISITNEYLDREAKYQQALGAYESALARGADLHLIESYKMHVDMLQAEVQQIKKALSSVNMSDEEMYEFAALEDKHPELRDIMDNWTAVSQNLLKMWRDVKLIPRERYESLSKIKDYVPWYRIMDDGLDMHDPDQSAPKTTTRSMTNIGREKFFKRGKPTAVIDFRAKAGQKEFQIQPSSSVEVEVNDVPVPQSVISVTADGKVTINLPLKENDLVVFKTHREIQNIIDNMTNNVMRMTINGLRQYAANRIVMEYASRNQKGKVMLFPKEDRNKGRFAWMLNGKKVFVEIQDPLVVQAIYGMENMNLKMFAPMAAVANLTRRTITLSPAFQVAQVFKDAPTAALVTGVKNPMTLIGGVWKGFITSLTGKEPVAEILKAAGIGGYYSPARTADDEVKRRLGVMNGNVYDKFIRALDHISDASDMAQRVAVYKRVMAETNDEMLAKYQAANVFNQMRHGASPYAQFFTRTIPFANAYAVTIDKLAQTLMGGGLKGMDRKKALARLGVCASMLAGISLLYAMAVGGDPEYEEIDDQTKLRNFVIPGTKIMLPMNTTAAFFFKAIPELVYNHITKKGTESEYDARRLREALSKVALDALTGPTPIPTAIKPLLEVSVNYSFFTGRAIVPPNLKDVEAAEQYTGSTSELGKAISAALEIPGTDGKRVLNPIEADHIVRGLFGTVGAMSQWVTNSIGSMAETRPEPSGKENPFIGTFLREEVPRGKEDLYYDLKGVVDTKYQTWVKMMERGAYEEADAFLDRNDAAISMHDFIRDTDAELKDINSEIRRLGESKDQDLSPKERRKEIDEYKRIKNEILEPVKDMRREIFK